MNECPDTPTGEHEWWYQPGGINASTFGEKRGYWYCNYKDRNDLKCRARTFSRPPNTKAGPR